MLLAKRTKPPFQWSFPGGGIEAGESAEDAAIREMREEVDIEIEIIAKAGEREVVLSDRRYLITVFAATLLTGEPKTGPEAAAVGWFALDEIASLETTPKLAEFAEAAALVFRALKA